MDSNNTTNQVTPNVSSSANGSQSIAKTTEKSPISKTNEGPTNNKAEQKLAEEPSNYSNLKPNNSSPKTPDMLYDVILKEVPNSPNSDIQPIPAKIKIGSWEFETIKLSKHPLLLLQLTDIQDRGYTSNPLGWLTLESAGSISYTIPQDQNWGCANGATMVTRWGYDGVALVLYKDNGQLQIRI